MENNESTPEQTSDHLIMNLTERLNSSIAYAEYIAEKLNQSVKYTEYLAEKLDQSLTEQEHITNRFNQIDIDLSVAKRKIERLENNSNFTIG
jgi:hypothetical protein